MAINIGLVQADYRLAFEEVGFKGTLLINTADGTWESHSNIRMLLRKTNPYDLVDPVDQDQSVLMILAEDLPAGVDNLRKKDRIQDSNGKEMSIQKADFNKRRIVDTTLALECLVRG